jgi:hypothetical protein
MGQWDIYLYDAATGKLKAKLTDDVALDASPTFSADGKWLYFTSDRSGISNVYRVDVARGMKSTEKITNVLTGVFQPAIPSDGKKMYVQYYNGSGFDIRKSEKIAPIKKSDERKEAIKREDLAQTIDVKELAAIPQVEELKFTPKKYQPFGKSFFLPRFIIPTFFTLNDGVMLGAFTGGTDPLRRHNWTGGVNWRTDLKSFPGYFASYWYNRYKPIFAAGIMDYAVDFGESPTFRLQPDPVGQPDVWVDHKFHLFEGRRRVWGGVTYPITKHAVGLQYFWEYRRPVGCWLYPAEKEWYNFGNYAGFNISYAYGDTERYPSSISSEHGTKLRANFSITDRWLGSAYTMEQRVFVGELREYANMPWANEVLAFKAQGGITFGDEFRQGTFTLGGDLGEGNFAAGGSLYYFPLRGIPVASLTGTRALLFSLEYRFPLINAQRGLGTTPLYVQNIHVAPFVDYGNAWTADYKTWGNGMYFFNDFLLGTGLEARGDFILGHGLPVSGRLGWGIIVVNRDRLLSTTKDPLLKSSIKNGMLILQLGTMF